MEVRQFCFIATQKHAKHAATSRVDKLEHKTNNSSQLTNGPSKLEYNNTLGWKGFPETNTLAYRAIATLQEKNIYFEASAGPVLLNFYGRNLHIFGNKLECLSLASLSSLV